MEDVIPLEDMQSVKGKGLLSPTTPVLPQAQSQWIASQARESDPEFDIFFEEDFARFKKKNYPSEEAKKSADHDKNAKAKMGKRLAKHGMSARSSLLNQSSKYQTALSNQSVSDGGPSVLDSPESWQKNLATDESVRIRALGRGFHKPVCNQYSCWCVHIDLVSSLSLLLLDRPYVQE